MIVELIKATDSKRYGGKAANLANLLKLGINVPDGWAISHDGFDKNGKLEFIDTLELDSDFLYAVRSSATVEDSVDNSWAGQFESFLYVPAKEVISRIEQCHKSAKSRTKAYALHAGKSEEFKVAVVVQQMIDPDYAGVIFTKNPVDNSNNIVGEYVKGVGESLVSGKTTPKEFSYNRSNGDITSKTKLPFDAKTLIRTSIQIEDAYLGQPQDIEWAVDKSNKIWFTQTRPITTLQNQQVATGLHYLGQPDTLFYWGPASAKPLYMSDFLLAEQNNFAKLFKSDAFPNPPKTLLLFKNGKSLWLNTKTDFFKFVEQIFNYYSNYGDLERDIKTWQKRIAEIDYEKVYDPKKLTKLLIDSWEPTLIAEFALYGSEASIAKELQEYTKQDQQVIWGAYTLPDLPSFINRIDADVKTIADPIMLGAKYPWALNSYAGVSSIDKVNKYFSERLKLLGNDLELATGSIDKRLEVAKTYKLSKNLVRKLDLARNLARFMDDRKAWMLQSRRVIEKCAKKVSEVTKTPLSELEQCTLQDLSLTKPLPYYGWTYINGKNIQLSDLDVSRSWDWYIDYAAAQSVLKGLVISRGGKHFMTGEVVVVHDPNQSVESDKILVVPSTSPSYVPLMRSAAALITDHGGMMSHAAIVAREFNLPCIVGTVNATKVLKNGDKVVIDLVNGEVKRK